MKGVGGMIVARATRVAVIVGVVEIVDAAAGMIVAGVIVDRVRIVRVRIVGLGLSTRLLWLLRCRLWLRRLRLSL